MWPRSDKNYLRFDEKSNTCDSLEKLLFFLNNIKNDLNFWKWAIIALHNSLYGSMILCLKGTSPTRVIKIDNQLKEKLKKLYKIENLNMNDSDHIMKVWLHGKVISFLKAFERIQQEKYMGMYVGSKFFISKYNYREAIEWINDELRNQFLHFFPRRWSIPISEFKIIFKDCLEIIEFCLFQSGNVLLEEEEQKLFEKILKNIKNHKELKK